ncbi:MAG: ABC transporter permease, partial [Anaerolineales bacterium]|nr:ABC transporter permease [Anaerolineales bacterium]
MLARYVWADLLRNPRRTLSTVAGVFLGVGLACAILFFVDGLSASMTQQAVAPLPIDMQQVLSAPPAGNILFTLTLEPAGAVAPGDIVHVRLELVNQGQTPVNELVVRAIPDDALVYIPGSATRDGSPLANALENPFAAGPAKAGLNIGTLAAGTTVILGYDLEAIAATAAIAQPIAATYSSREAVTPVVANAAAPLNPAELAARLRAIEGIAFAEQLAFVDLPAGALAASRPTDSLVRVFGFDQSYTSHDRSILISEGGQTAGAAMLSAEAAAYLAVNVGDTVTLALPDGASLELAVSGIVDLTQARSLFSSRRGADFETFIYIPNAIIVDSALFAEVVVPAFERVAADRGERVKNPPIHEIALGVDRERLDAEPAVALRQTEQIAAQVAATAGEQGYLLDNISNALTVARADANLAKRMFAFLGVPGAILAATLAAYAGIVLAGAQRREQAILRIRGANRRHLLAMLALRVGTITLTGAIIGVVLGYSTAVSVVGSAALGRAALTSLATSAVLGTLAGLLATGGALYVTGRRSIDHEINEEKARLWSEPPAWWQYRLDLAGLLLLAIATGITAAMGGFAGMPGSVYVGRPVDLPIELLVLPIAAWMAGALLGGRGLAAILRRGQARGSTIGARPLQFLYQRSIRRRVWVLVDVAVILGMVIALGTSLAIFAASYDGAKIADARFIVGSDLKIWPSPGNERLYGSADADAFMVPGVKRVTPVIFGVHNVILRSNRTSEVANLAAVDADTYAQIAPLQDAHFPGSSAASELSQLAGQPDALLLSVEM